MVRKHCISKINVKSIQLDMFLKVTTNYYCENGATTENQGAGAEYKG